MNRYDVASVAKFSPLSFNELAAAPTMMRQKHDASIAQAEALRIKADPLDVHLNRATELKNQMDNEIAKNVDTLNKEGYNPTTFQNIQRLNRQYQDMISPTGEIGQINAAKQVYAKNFNDYLDDAQKNKGWSRERALANWNDFSKQYTGFDNDKIANIGQLGAPKKVEVLDVLKDVKGLLGEQVVGEMKASGYNFQPSPDGGMVMVDRSGRRIETSNRPNLQAAQNLINQRLMGKEWQDSIKFEGEDTKNIYGQLTSGINAMLSNKVVDNRSENAQYIAPKTPGEGNDSQGSKLIENNTLFSPNALTSSSYLDNSKTLQSLQSRKSSLNSEERGKLAELETFQNKVNADLKNNSEYNFANKELNSFLNKFSQNTKTILKDPILRQSFQPMETSSKGIFNAKGQDGKPIKGSDGKLLQFTASQIKAIHDNREKPFEYENKLNRITNKITEENGITEYGYQLVPQTSKDETSIKLATETLENALKSGPKSLLNYANIESVDIGGVSRTGLDVEDKEKIQEVFNNSERGSFKIVSFIPKTSKGKPGYIIEFNTKEGNSSNLNRYFRNESGSGEIGNGKPVRIKINYDQSKGKVLNTANGYIQEYLSDKGDIDPRTGRKQGFDLAMDMRANADKSQINNEISKSNIKWGSMITPTTDFEKLNPFVQKQLQKELIKNYGLNNDTSDTELENMIKSFIKKEGSNNIYIE